MISIFDRSYYRYNGRILVKNDSVYLGYTNSSVEFYVQGETNQTTKVTATIESHVDTQPNFARLRVYIDDVNASNITLDTPTNDYDIASFSDGQVHKIRIVKITEALFSTAKFQGFHIEQGKLLPLPSTPDIRKKVEFIGDSITCGYGVLGAPESEFDIAEEDGELSYACLVAKELNLNARYTSASGFGVYCEYTGDVNNTLPRIYPYINRFEDDEVLYDFQDFTPDLVVVNLGTNDSRYLGDEAFQKKFITCYIDFLKFIRSQYPACKILCVLGTLCEDCFQYIQKACDIITEEGYEDIYTLELPYHNVAEDGQASNHPSLVTHQKDAKRIIAKIMEIMPELNV